MFIIKNITEIYHIRGDSIKVTSKCKFNKKTGKPVFDEYLDNIATSKALNIYRKRHNMITPLQIKELRNIYGLSQRDFATLLGWSPTTIVSYENGTLPSKSNSNVLLLLIKNNFLAEHFFKDTNYSLSHLGRKHFRDFINNNVDEYSKMCLMNFIESRYRKVNKTEYTGYIDFNFMKFANLVVYFASHMKNLTKTKLCKLLFYTDSLNYSLQTVSITGIPYIKLSHGPVPDEYEELYRLLEYDNLIVPHIKDFNGVESTCFTANHDNCLASVFNKSEWKIIRFVTNHFENTEAGQISRLSHNELGWKKTSNHKGISYNYSLQSPLLKKYINFQH